MKKTLERGYPLQLDTLHVSTVQEFAHDQWEVAKIVSSDLMFLPDSNKCPSGGAVDKNQSGKVAVREMELGVVRSNCPRR